MRSILSDKELSRRGHGGEGGILALLLVVAIGGVAMGMTARTAAATTVVAGQNGWDGNSVIYLT